MIKYLLDQKAFRFFTTITVGGMGMLGAGYLLYVNITTTNEIQHEFGKSMQSGFEDLRIRMEASNSQTATLLQKICARMSETKQEVNDCLTFGL